MTLLAIENLTKSFGGVHAIAQLDLQVREGAVNSIIGPNGAGKTSLINLLSGVYAPDTGSIRLDWDHVITPVLTVVLHRQRHCVNVTR